MDHREALALDKAVKLAHRLWSEILTDRRHEGDPTHKSSVHYDKITSVLESTRGTIKGELLHMAVLDAQSREVPRDDEHDRASQQFRSALNARRSELAPPPTLATPDRSTRCRHDVAYTDTCEACGA